VPVTSTVFGRPTVAELVEAVTEYLEASVMPQAEGAARFEARVARNVLAIVGRELALAPGAALHTRNAFAVSVQPTTATWRQASAPATTTRISSGGHAAGRRRARQLLVANPPYLGELQ